VGCYWQETTEILGEKTVSFALLMHCYPSHWLDVGREPHSSVALSLTVLFYFPLDGSTNLLTANLFVSGNLSVTYSVTKFHVPVYIRL
jgi:hypothetical protein